MARRDGSCYGGTCSGLGEGESGLEVEVELAVGVDVAVCQRCQCSAVDAVESDGLVGLAEDLLDHECVDVDECCLEEVQAQRLDFLVLSAVGGDVAMLAVADEAVG